MALISLESVLYLFEKVTIHVHTLISFGLTLLAEIFFSCSVTNKYFEICWYIHNLHMCQMIDKVKR
jgi:hypothetical protein